MLLSAKHLLADETLPMGTKGLPPGHSDYRLMDLGAQGWNILRQDVSFPIAVLRDDALAHNSRTMQRFVARTGVQLYPHGKTTMAPQLFAQQFADGAAGLTAATVAHLVTYRRFGINGIFYANQLVDPRGIAFVLDELARDPDFDFVCLVDSVAGIERLRAVASARGSARPIQVLVELGLVGGRTGARSVGEAVAVARAAAKAAPWLALRGVEAFEGILSLTGDSAATSRIDALLSDMRAVAMAIHDEGLAGPGPLLLSAGGSAFFEHVADRLVPSLPTETRVILRSGCYLVHDHGLYEQALSTPSRAPASAALLDEPLQPALEVWGIVQSLPEPGLAILTLGKRDVSYDIHPPRPILWFRPGLHDRPQAFAEGAAIRALNDQHAYVQLSEAQDLAVGDLVAVGISHPCTTFDKWQVLLRVNSAYDVVGAVRTYF